MTVLPSAPTTAPTRRGGWVAVGSLLGATLCWAGNYVVGASAVQSIDPVSLVALRWALALLPLLVVAQLVERPRWGQVWRAWPWLIALSGCGLLGYNLLLYGALQHIDAFNAALVNAFNPAVITLAAAAFLRQRLTPRAVGGVAVALVGVLIVLSGGDVHRLLGGGFGVGQLLMIGAILAWTAYTVIGRLAPPLPPITSTAAQAAVTTAVMLPISVAGGGPALPATPGAGWALAFIALFPSVVSYLLWNRALVVIPAARAGVFLNLITVFTAVITIATGHPYTGAQLLGGAVVITGVVITNTRSRRARGGAPQTPDRSDIA